MKRPLSLLMILVALVGASTAAQAQAVEAANADAAAADASDLEQRVDALIHERRFDEATALLRLALSRYPDHPGLMASALWLLAEAPEKALDEAGGPAGAGPAPSTPAEIDQPGAGTAGAQVLARDLAGEVKDAQARAKQLESEVDSLIERLEFGRASNRLEAALKDFPDHEGLRASATLLSVLRVAYWLLICLGVIAAGMAIAVALAAWSGKPFVAAGVYVIGIYLVAIPGALLLGLIGMFLSREGAPEYLRQAVLVVMSCFLGALGGAIQCSFLLAATERTLRKRSAFRYLFYKPLNGFFLAGVMYVALMSGQLVLFGGPSVPSTWSVALLATLTGLLSEGALARLQRLGNMMFAPKEPEGEKEEEAGDDAKDSKRVAGLVSYPAAAAVQEA
ncbi:MAG TPA: hypothetical protein VNJ70_12280 [Thermoanaerobaculia bacterium]|nr:hypothetical protein [Thermoanaerobaculia bacterium]